MKKLIAIALTSALLFGCASAQQNASDETRSFRGRNYRETFRRETEIKEKIRQTRSFDRPSGINMACVMANTRSNGEYFYSDGKSVGECYNDHMRRD